MTGPANRHGPRAGVFKGLDPVLEKKILCHHEILPSKNDGNSYEFILYLYSMLLEILTHNFPRVAHFDIMEAIPAYRPVAHESARPPLVT